MKHLIAVALVSLSAGAASAQTVDDLSWMSGCWAQVEGNRRIEEYWTPVRGGLLMGAGITLMDDAVRHFEHMRIETLSGVVTFTAIPSGQAQTSFAAVSFTDGEIIFENAANDFPHRVTYRRVAGGLQAAIEGPMNGKPARITFDYRPCAMR